MHDKIFQNQSEWANENALSILLGYGTQLGLDQAAYEKCLSGHEMAQKVKDSATAAANFGLSSTPSFVFNSGGKLYLLQGAQPYATFQKAIDSLLGGTNP